MPLRVARWGNSLALRLPKLIAEQAGLDEGTAIEVTVDDGKLVVTAARSGPTLEELVAGITPENRHGETDWGRPVGREEW